MGGCCGHEMHRRVKGDGVEVAEDRGHNRCDHAWQSVIVSWIILTAYPFVPIITSMIGASGGIAGYWELGLASFLMVWSVGCFYSTSMMGYDAKKHHCSYYKGHRGYHLVVAVGMLWPLIILIWAIDKNRSDFENIWNGVPEKTTLTSADQLKLQLLMWFGRALAIGTAAATVPSFMEAWIARDAPTMLNKRTLRPMVMNTERHHLRIKGNRARTGRRRTRRRDDEMEIEMSE